MRIIGIDPGAKFTGIAVLNATTGEFEFWAESDDPVAIWEMVVGQLMHGYDGEEVHIVIEDILGGGRRDEYVQRTIEVLGYLYNRCREIKLRVTRVAPQARLANVSRVPKKIRGKDEKAAAAHALSYKEGHGL